MKLFEFSENGKLNEKPLSLRMRPRTLEEFIGQEHVIGKGKILRQAIETDSLFPCILWGPPGCGKSSLANIISRNTKANFVQISAVTAGLSELKVIVKEAEKRKQLFKQRTILFIDEIHRFNKAQQDALLPYVEDGTVILIGATTENPFFEVISPLVSRSRVFQLKPLSESEIEKIIQDALKDKERGLGNFPVEVTEEGIKFLVRVSNGDARVALNALEWAFKMKFAESPEKIILDTPLLQDALQKRAITYDKDADAHYDTISAFIKSMRGSDPDATLFWLAKMLYAGEDPKFIARRIMICASEDVGNADPQAIVIATACAQAVQFIGIPEAMIPLAQAAIYVACAPKSNSAYMGIAEAMKDVEEGKSASVPLHLKDANYPQAAQLGHGKDYKYAHEFEGHFVLQQYLPDELKMRQYYYPSEEGLEKTIKERLKKLWGKLKKYDL
ncbi:MAG: replication-associated recombination protein A [Coprothermobacterota bacterium]|nr:replication-associated recombination protein A [Coprothermobacterota bacterium]